MLLYLRFDFKGDMPMPDSSLVIAGILLDDIHWKICHKLVDFTKPQSTETEHLFIRHRVESAHLFFENDGMIWLATEAKIDGLRVVGPNRLCRKLGFR